MGSSAVVEVNSGKVRGRLYPWGIVEGTRFYHLLKYTIRGGQSVHLGVCLPLLLVVIP